MASKTCKLDIWSTFIENYPPRDMSCLKTAIRKLLSDRQSFLKACSLKTANCSASVSFKRAHANVEEHIDKLFPLGAIFDAGLGILVNFLNTKTAPVGSRDQLLLEVLLNYLLDKEVHDTLSTMGRHCKTETDITVMIVNHLLLRITPNAGCILAKGASYKVFPFCPDRCELKMKNTTIDDTSIGNPAVWHGRVDALVGSVAVTRLSANSDDSDDDVGEEDDSDNDNGLNIRPQFVEMDTPNSQVVSQAIVFSFLQNQQEKEQHAKSLIPTIGISTTQLVIYFYDPENDVLLQSACFFFNRSEEEKIRAIIVAWLVVNYKQTCDGLIDPLTKVPKANFVSLCDDTALDIYKSHLMHGGVGKGETQLSVFKYENSTLVITSAAQNILNDIACL